MKILFQSRSTLFTVPGGDTIQISKTAEALRAHGLRVDISTELEPDLSAYDMVHLFNLMRPQDIYLQAMNAKKQRKKIVLSTIYGPYVEYDRKGRGGLSGLLAKIFSHSQLEYLKVVARAVKNQEINFGTLQMIRHGYYGLQTRIMGITNVLLPNSESEMNRIIKDFPMTSEKSFIVVPNAVDTKLFDRDRTEMDRELTKFAGCLLCVARIERRKSQLNLVRAMKGLPWPLVLIGKPAPNHVSYFEQIKKEAGPNVHILGHLDHNMLPQFYKVARVHCLISWMETPGLSSLEAGAMGCNLVITNRGDTRDYFGDYAFYCEPDDIDSIKKAIIQAYEAPINPELRNHIMQYYTWDKAAEASLKGYEAIIY